MMAGVLQVGEAMDLNNPFAELERARASWVSLSLAPLRDAINSIGTLVILRESELTVCTMGWSEKWHIPIAETRFQRDTNMSSH